MTELTRDEADSLPGLAVLEFGASWCPHCHAIRAAMAENLRRHANVRHIMIEDGRGKRLGRSYRVKLWPTLIFLKNGEEVARLVRPEDDEISDVFARIATEAKDS